MKGKEMMAVVGISAVVDKAFNSAISDSQKKLGKLGSFSRKTAKVIKASAVAAAGLAGSAIKIGVEFDASMSKVSAISGATGKSLEKLRDQAKELGKTTQFSMSEVSEAMQYMAMAGWKTNEILSGTKGILDLAAASGEDLATTSDIVTDALTAFGMKAEESGRFADVLAAASSNANTNVSMMGETFKYVAPLAGALKYSAEDVAVNIGLMANSGVKASQAGTAMSAWLSRLASPTKDSATAMEKLGLSITDSNGKMKPLLTTTKEVRKKFANLTEAQKAQYAKMLAGQDAMKGFLAIVNASDEDFQKLTKSIYGSEGAAAKMAETMNNNLAGQLKEVRSRLEYVANAFAEAVMPYLVKVTQYLLDHSDQLTAKMESFFKMIQKVLKFIEEHKVLVVSALGAMAGAIAGLKLLKFAADMKTAISAIGGISTIAKIFNVKILLIMAAIGVLIAGGRWLYKNWDKVKNFFVVIAQEFVNAFNAMKDGIMKAVTAVKDGVVSGFTFMKNGAVKVFTAMRNKIGSIMGSLASIVKKPINAVISIVNKMIDSVNKLSFDIPDWVPGIGGDTVGFNVPHLPMLEQGGLTAGPSIAGEGRYPEMVISQDPRWRSQNIGNWETAGRMLGVSDPNYRIAGDRSVTTVDMGSINYSPVINVQGNADRTEILKALEEDRENFKDMLRELFSEMQEYVYA